MTLRRKKKIALRKLAKTAKPPMDAFALLTLFIEAVSAYYDKDPTKAGVVISKVPEGYYVSVVRYLEMYGKSKTVVLHEKNADLEVALRTVARRWHELVAPPLVTALLKKLGTVLADALT